MKETSLSEKQTLFLFSSTLWLTELIQHIDVVMIKQFNTDLVRALRYDYLIIFIVIYNYFWRDIFGSEKKKRNVVWKLKSFWAALESGFGCAKRENESLHKAMWHVIHIHQLLYCMIVSLILLLSISSAC